VTTHWKQAFFGGSGLARARQSSGPTYSSHVKGTPNPEQIRQGKKKKQRSPFTVGYFVVSALAVPSPLQMSARVTQLLLALTLMIAAGRADETRDEWAFCVERARSVEDACSRAESCRRDGDEALLSFARAPCVAACAEELDRRVRLCASEAERRVFEGSGLWDSRYEASDIMSEFAPYAYNDYYYTDME